MTTAEKVSLLHDSSDVFESSSSSSEDDADETRVSTPTSLKGLRRPASCSSLARMAVAHVPRRPASLRRRLRTGFTTGAILTAVLLERVSYFSIVGNLVLFCTNVLELSSGLAVTVDLVFIGVCYTVPLVGGRIADMIAGRFNTIFGSFLILLVGICLLPVVAVDYFTMFGYDAKGHPFELSMEWRRLYFVIGIVLCGIGFGGIKANISPLGAQQVEWFGEQAVHSFFNWFFWFINVGGCIAYLLVVYIQQEIGFDIGYLIPAATVLVACIFFLIPRNYYREHPRGEGLVGRFMSILWAGMKSCVCGRGTCGRSTSRSGLLDGARLSCGGEYDDDEVDIVRDITMTVPIFLTLIIFSAFTSQRRTNAPIEVQFNRAEETHAAWRKERLTTTTMILQGERMDARFGSDQSKLLPVASLNFVKMGVVTALIPVLDRFIFPLLSRVERKPSLLQRIGFGMAVGVLSLVLMGVVEMVRKHDMSIHGCIEQNVGGVHYNASRVSLLWQTPQFLLVGIAETFTLVAALEFAYTESPFGMQGMVMGMNHVTTGLGALIGSAFYNAVAIATEAAGLAWLPNEINDGKLEWFAFLLAGVLLGNLIVFILLARHYRYNCLGVPSTMPGTPCDLSAELRRATRSSLTSGPLLVVPDPN